MSLLIAANASSSRIATFIVWTSLPRCFLFNFRRSSQSSASLRSSSIGRISSLGSTVLLTFVLTSFLSAAIRMSESSLPMTYSLPVGGFAGKDVFLAKLPTESTHKGGGPLRQTPRNRELSYLRRPVRIAILSALGGKAELALTLTRHPAAAPSARWSCGRPRSDSTHASPPRNSACPR